MNEFLVEALDSLANPYQLQISELVDQGFLRHPVGPEDEVTELVIDFFETMVSGMDAAEKWREQCPKLALLYDFFDPEWGADLRVNSVAALLVSDFWDKVRAMATDAKVEILAKQPADSH